MKNMNKKDVGSISIMKIIGISLICMIVFGISATATELNFRSVEITMANGYKMNIVTTKKTVAEVLEDNNIVVEENERVIPNLNENITEDNKINITNKSEHEVQIAKISESGVQTTLDEILKSYEPIVEKIVVEQEAIPFETITKDSSNGVSDTKNKVIQQGEDGIKEITYKIKYQNDVELEKIVISENIVKEPVDKIVQVQKNVTSRGTNIKRDVPESAKKETEHKGKTKIFKVTAYCSCPKCCGKNSSGHTSSGKKAKAGRTVATSSQFAFGTKLKIQGKEYVVEDRGGAIKGDKIDIFMDSHSEALAWGVRYLPVEVIE